MYERFTDSMRAIMREADEKAQLLKNEFVTPAHILFALCQHVLKKEHSEAALLFRTLQLNARSLLESLQFPASAERDSQGRLPQVPQAKKLIEFTMEDARDLHHSYCGAEHLVLAFLRKDAPWSELFKEQKAVDHARRELRIILAASQNDFTKVCQEAALEADIPVSKQAILATKINAIPTFRTELVELLKRAWAASI